MESNDNLEIPDGGGGETSDAPATFGGGGTLSTWWSNSKLVRTVGGATKSSVRKLYDSTDQQETDVPMTMNQWTQQQTQSTLYSADDKGSTLYSSHDKGQNNGSSSSSIP